MPSLHVGWSTWCALVLVATAPYLWVRILGALFPVATFVLVLGTANHWVLDATGGLVALGSAYLLQYALTGQRLCEHQVSIIGRSASAFTGDDVSLAVPVRGRRPNQPNAGRRYRTPQIPTVRAGSACASRRHEQSPDFSVAGSPGRAARSFVASSRA
jgi:PAP2 superfamily